MDKKPTAVIFDIDGVLCDSTERHQKIRNDAAGRGDFQTFYKSLLDYSKSTDGDKLIEKGKKLFEDIKESFRPSKIFFITSRGEHGRQPTKKWLEKHGLYDDELTDLIMRPEIRKDKDGIYRSNQKWASDAAYKRDMASGVQSKYKVLLAIDDLKDNCDAFRSLKIPTIQAEFVKIPHVATAEKTAAAV
jgi:phosphoglycolate phosphatase-like HAD superfamily hydrolase